MDRETLEDPSPDDLNDPIFEAVWQAIKGWDLSRTSNGLYAGATGTDVMTILRAVRPEITRLQSALDREQALPLRRATNRLLVALEDYFSYSPSRRERAESTVHAEIRAVLGVLDPTPTEDRS